MQKIIYNLRIKYNPMALTIEKRKFIQTTPQTLLGNASMSLASFMYDNYNKHIFNTFEINVFENNKLVAFSFF